MKKPPRRRYSRSSEACRSVRSPFADLDGVEPGPIVGIAFVEVDGLFDGAHVDAGEAAKGLGEVAVGAGVILGPEREALAPVAVEAAGVAVVGTGGIHEAGEGIFGGLVPIGRGFEVLVFDAGELAEGALESVEGGEGGDGHFVRIFRVLAGGRAYLAADEPSDPFGNLAWRLPMACAGSATLFQKPTR
jgi:hypothetical protein